MRLNNKLFAISIIIIVSSCSRNFGDTNINPQATTSTTFHSTMTSIQSLMNIPDYNYQAYLRNEIMYPTSQLTSLVKQIGVDPVLRSTDAIWSDYYKFLANVNTLNTLINNYHDQDALVNLKAMKNVIVAYKTFTTVSLYGDIPFSEGGKAFTPERIFRPKYDDQAAIFTTAFNDLKWAADNFTTNATTSQGNNYLNIGSNDVIYGNDIAKWKKLANSLLLKYAIFLFDKMQTLAGPVITDILNNNKPLLQDEENFQYLPNVYLNPRDRRGTYQAAGSNGVRLGETMWKNLSSTTNLSDTTGANIFDYRTYIFFEKNAYGSWYPAKQIGNTETDFGDVYSNDRVGSPNTRRSRFASVNIYLLSNQTVVPEIFLSVAEVNFLKAEAYARGLGVTKNWIKAEEEYNKGIESSILYWSKIGQAISNWTVDKPAAATVTNINNVKNNNKVKLLVTDTETEKLTKIYTQYWVSLFWQPEEAYKLMRRTTSTPVTGSYSTSFYRLTYPISEKEQNVTNYNSASSKIGGDMIATKLWWMK